MKIAFFGTPTFAVPSLEQLVAAGEQIVTAITQPDRPAGTWTPRALIPLQDRRAGTWHPGDATGAGRRPGLRRGAGLLRRRPGGGGRLRQNPAGHHSAHTPSRNDQRTRVAVAQVSWCGAGAPRYHRGRTGDRRHHNSAGAGDGRRSDAGRVVRPIAADETSDVVDRALAEIGASLLVSTVREIAAGQATEQPQDDTLATLAPRLTTEDGRLDWTRPARGRPQPGPWAAPVAARLQFSRPVPILDSAIRGRAASGLVSAQAPGNIVEAGGDRLHVACGAGTVLAIHELQPEGRRRLPTRAFLAGHPIDLPAILRPFPPVV